MAHPVLTCLDMEGVLVPEIWLAVAEKLGVRELQMTTRDIPDYDELMKKRLAILQREGIKLRNIQEIVESLNPLEGAVEFLDWLRHLSQVVILSDTYYEFLGHLTKELRFPTIFCHTLGVDENGFITHYFLRQQDQKRQAVIAFKSLGFRVLAGGDSYNDISMLKEADAGILFRPPDTIQKEFPQYPVTHTYTDFKERLSQAGAFQQ